MREPIVHDQPGFERWLVSETAVYARMVERIDSGRSKQTGIGADMTNWRFIFLLETVGRYTDRHPEDLKAVAHDEAALMDVIREGRSLIATSKAKAEAARKEEEESS